MSRKRNSHILAETAAHYSISLYGRMTEGCAERLWGMQATVVNADGEWPVTILTGRLPDQAALAGVLMCIYEYGLPLIALQRREEFSAWK
jgi:hypothetical protein